jgi:ABC-type branched-subunit amino acid transport system ATPase component
MNTFYGKSHVLNDVSLDVCNGEIVALLGPTAPASRRC